jgi:hypothetical protein
LELLFTGETIVERVDRAEEDTEADGPAHVEACQSDSFLNDVLVGNRSAEAVKTDQGSPGPESAASMEQELITFGKCFREASFPTPTYSVLEDCVRIRGILETNHVKWDNAERHGFIDELLKPDRDARRVLGTGFHRLVVLDAALGLDPEGRFDDYGFLEAVRAEIAKAFGLRLEGVAFHVEDIFQMLKDEKRSLFCFANFQLIPVVHFRTLRGFTQGVHRVLLLTRGSRDIAWEEGHSRSRGM